MATIYEICCLHDIPDGGSKGFVIKTGEYSLEIFIVRKDKQVYGYLNRCPHTGVNLDWSPDEFLDIERKFIICSTHGAKFRIEDGYCFLGPCVGDNLKPITIVRKHDHLHMTL